LNPRYERLRVQTFGITWLVYASYYLTRKSFTAAKVVLANDPSVALTRQQFGLVDAAYLTTYSLGQFIFGPLVDRFGSRKILLFGMLLSVLVATANGFARTATVFLVLAVLQGAAQSTGWTANSKAMSGWFSLRERGRVLGLWCTNYSAGSAIATPFAALMMDRFGHVSSVSGTATFVPYWPAAFWGPAAVVAIVALLMWLFLYNRPEDFGLPPIERYHGEPDTLLDDEERGHIAAEGSWELVREVLSSPSIWLLAVAYFPVKLARYALDFWGPIYVNESLGTSALTSAITSTLMPVGGILGAIIAGYLSDRVFQNRRAPVIIIDELRPIDIKRRTRKVPQHNRQYCWQI
jgi:OPA family sugar phosphate sensor protein UhpC-like MFS transporter